MSRLVGSNWPFICRSCLDKTSRSASRQLFTSSRAITTRSNRLRSSTLALSRTSQLLREQPCRTTRVFTNSTPLSKSKESNVRLLPLGPARTRFAPSPTGYMHLGSLRTALFNYLLAKKTGGQFLLRIEDTDQKRLVSDAQERLCNDLKWAGIQWDEGPDVGGPFGPYKQSERTHIYQEYTGNLLESKAAYRCFCDTATQARVEAEPALLETAVGRCHSDCASIPSEESARRAHSEKHCVRFGKPAKTPNWSDLVYGDIALEGKKALPRRVAVEGVILLKSDGTPTYHLANVVDDHHMRITHVIRGTEWMSSTALHVALYNAFGWEPPAFAHVGLLTDKNQAKLSKRNADTDLNALKLKHGILPESMLNFLALLGWRNPTRDDVMEMDRMIDLFDLKFTKGNSIVAFDKMHYLQKKHAKLIIDRAMATSTPDPRFEELVDFIGAAALTAFPESQIMKQRNLRAYIKSILAIDNKNYENPTHYVDRNEYFFTTLTPTETSLQSSLPEADLQTAAREIMSHDSVKALANTASSDGTDCAALSLSLKAAADAYSKAIEAVCKSRASGDSEEARAKYKEWNSGLHRYIRAKTCFGRPGPGSQDVMAVLGHEECLRRFEL